MKPAWSFQVQPGQSYTLMGGNPQASEASYDLAKSIQGIDEFMLPLVSLGPPTAIQQREPIRPWSERHSTLLWIILALAVTAMLILILGSLKKLSSSPKQP